MGLKFRTRSALTHCGAAIAGCIIFAIAVGFFGLSYTEFQELARHITCSIVIVLLIVLVSIIAFSIIYYPKDSRKFAWKLSASCFGAFGFILAGSTKISIRMPDPSGDGGENVSSQYAVALGSDFALGDNVLIALLMIALLGLIVHLIANMIQVPANEQ